MEHAVGVGQLAPIFQIVPVGLCGARVTAHGDMAFASSLWHRAIIAYRADTIP